MRGLRIGYAPIDARLRAPGDRRRFGFFAKRRGLEFEIARRGSTYDLLVLSSRADITWWSRTPRGRTAIVYDLIDSYLAFSPVTPKSLGRGLAKFVSRETSRLAPSYLHAIRCMCRRADAVVCSTHEQRSDILPLCPNVHIILDSHTELVRQRKKTYHSGEVFNLVWEGLPHTLSGFGVIEDVLRELRGEHELVVHLITDLRFHQFGGRFRERASDRIASRMLDRFCLYEWNDHILPHIVTACDLGVIPLDLSDPFARGKPENKLLLLWRLGLPVLASATPAYRRAMDACELPMYCETSEDWRTKLRLYMNDDGLRAEAGRRGAAFAEEAASDETLLAAWDAAVASALASRD